MNTYPKGIVLLVSDSRVEPGPQARLQTLNG